MNLMAAEETLKMKTHILLGFLAKYFFRQQVEKEILLNLIQSLNITQKHKTVLSGLLSLSYAETISYSDFAKKIGFEGQTRYIATLIAKNPIPVIIPCHKVIKKNSEKSENFGNYIFGSEAKKHLINFENKKIQKINKEYQEIIEEFYFLKLNIN